MSFSHTRHTPSSPAPSPSSSAQVNDELSHWLGMSLACPQNFPCPVCKCWTIPPQGGGIDLMRHKLINCQSCKCGPIMMDYCLSTASAAALGQHTSWLGRICVNVIYLNKLTVAVVSPSIVGKSSQRSCLSASQHQGSTPPLPIGRPAAAAERLLCEETKTNDDHHLSFIPCSAICS